MGEEPFKIIINSNLIMNVRQATITDFDKIYQLGERTPEFRVSDSEPFIDKEDLELRITGGEDLILLAEEENEIRGFALWGLKDKDRPLKNRSACFTYLVVDQNYRNRGIATRLYDQGLVLLRER